MTAATSRAQTQPTGPGGQVPSPATQVDTAADPNAQVPQGAVQGIEDATDSSQPTNDIVVTGTLIRNPNLVASSPVNSIGEGEILLRQPNTPEELLRGIPGVSPGVGSQVNNGATGTNTVDLRGLGVQRNLVLLDGNRTVVFR